MEIPRYDIREYDTIEIPGVELTARDDRLLRRLRAGREESRQLNVVQLPGRVEVRSSFWVGVARFEQFEVHVKPKLVGSEDVLLEMIEYATNAYSLRRFDAARTYAASPNPSLLELFAIMLAEGCERLLQQGLLADYVQREDLLPAVRGRILVDQQVLKRFGVVDRVYCRYDEREHDVLENQLLLLSLQVAYRMVSRRFVKARLRRCMMEFENVCSLDGFDADAARRLSFHRLNERYRDVHAIAWAIIDASGLEDFYKSGSISSFSFFINMNTLFERFVEQLMRDAFPSGVRVRTQTTDGSVIRDALTGETYKNIRPDVLLERGSSRLPIDAKYKLYGQKSVSTADVYQLYFYGRAYNDHEPSALLVFAAEKTRVDRLELRDANQAHMGRLASVGVSVADFLRGDRFQTLATLRASVTELNPELLAGNSPTSPAIH